MGKVTYDAFISYSHSEPDAFVAKKLHAMLEHYHISKKLQQISGKKKISRVFRDREELSLSSDLALNIREALENSQFLIVVCSPRAVRSEWVQREIEAFLETHEKDKILTVWAEGEPEEAFPKILCYKEKKNILETGEEETVNIRIEPKAADVRGRSRREMEKRLKAEFLGILAPMLSCTYDTLKQRHRDYMFRKIIAAVGSIAVLAVMFMVYAFQQAAVIDERYQEARRNQARYLSSISSDLLASGHREKALLTALAVEPEADSEQPVVPEQMYALNSALTSYKSGFKIGYNPAYAGEADEVSYGVLSKDGLYYFAVDGNGNMAVLSGETGERMWTITPEDIKDSLDDLSDYKYENFEKISYVFPISEQDAAVVLSYCIAIVNVESKAITFTFPVEEGFFSDVYAYFGELLAFSRDAELYVYNLYTGERVRQLNLNKNNADSKIEYDIESLSFNEGADAIAIGLSYEWKEDSYDELAASYEERKEHQAAAEKWFAEHPPEGVVIYHLEDGTKTVLSNIQALEVLYADETHVAAIHFTDPVSGSVVNDSWGNSNYSYSQALYELPSGKLLFQGETTTVLSTSYVGLVADTLGADDKSIPVLISWIRGSLTVLNLNTGEVINEITYGSNIIGVSFCDTYRLFVGMNDGSVQMISVGSDFVRRQILSLDAQVSQFEYSSALNEIILISNKEILICDDKMDPGMTLHKMTDLELNQVNLKDVSYVETQEGIYRYFCLYGESFLDIAGIMVFPVNSEECIYQYICSDAGNSITNISFGTDEEGVLYLCFLESMAGDQLIFRKVNVFTGEIKIQEDVTSYDTLQFDYPGIVFTSDLRTMFVYRSKGAVRFDISGETLVPENRAILARQSIEEMAMTGDGRYLVLEASAGYDNTQAIYLYEVDTCTLSKLELGAESASDPEVSSIVSGLNSSYICLCSRENKIYIVDCEQRSVLKCLSYDGNDTYGIAFFDDDQYLLMATKNNLYMYCIEKEEIVYTYTLPASMSGLRLLTDSSSHYFALRDDAISENPDYNTGVQGQAIYIFYVDEKYRFYLSAKINEGYSSLSGTEVVVVSGDRYAYTRFYNYKQLRERALEVLNGRALTMEEKQEYFIAE